MVLAGVELDDRLGLGGDPRLAVGVGHADERVGVADVELAAQQRHAEGRVEPGHEDVALLGDAVAVGVAQQRDAVRRRGAGASAAHQEAHGAGDDAAALARGAVGLGHQYVAVGEAIEPARMVEPFCEGGDLEPGGGGGLAARGPADRLGDLDGRDRLDTRRGDVGPRAGDRGDRQLGLVGPAEVDDHADRDDDDDREDADDVLEHQAKVGGEGAGGNGVAHSTDHVRLFVIPANAGASIDDADARRARPQRSLG